MLGMTIPIRQVIALTYNRSCAAIPPSGDWIVVARGAAPGDESGHVERSRDI